MIIVLSARFPKILMATGESMGRFRSVRAETRGVILIAKKAALRLRNPEREIAHFIRNLLWRSEAGCSAQRIQAGSKVRGRIKNAWKS
jgi:hypothetical protein